MTLETVAGWVHRVSRLLMVFAAVSMLFILGIVAFDIVSRTVGEKGLRGSSEFAELLLPAAAYLAMGYTQITGGHVASTVLTDRLPRHVANTVRALANLVAAVFIGFVAFFAIGVALEAYTSGEFRYGLTSTPLWPAKTAVAVGLVALAAELAVTAARLYRARRDSTINEPDEVAGMRVKVPTHAGASA